MTIPFRNLTPWIAGAIALFTLAFTQRLSAVEAILTGDAYTDANKANTNYGNATTLPVSGSGSTLKRAWINFDLPSVLPAGTTSGQISKATLKLWVSTAAAGGPINVYTVIGTTAWVEGTGANGSGITNGTAPALAASPLISGWQIIKAGNFAAVDVTSLVQSWVSGSSINRGIALTPGLSTVNVSFDSKESTTTSHGPVLEIELVNQGPAGPQGPQGLTGAVGPIGPQGLQGLTGPTGSQGLQGLTGPTGATGEPGPQGVAGAVGPAGATGTAGPKGLNWKGTWNNTTAYAIDDSVSINGSSYIALVANTNVQPPAAGTWSLVSAKGDAGATGAQGPQGLAGAAGETGPVGPQGPQGLTGADGATGPQGLQGLAGPAGPTGPQGPQGDGFWQTQDNAIYFNTGAVGIGISSPVYPLDVAGDARIVGQVLIIPAGDLSMGTFQSGPRPIPEP